MKRGHATMPCMLRIEEGGYMATYGYARVSTRDQKIDRQIDALSSFPINENRIFVDYFTGASFKRPNYLALMEVIRKNDLLVVKSIDRLGRNYNEILDQWRYLTKDRGVDILVLDMPLLDTRSSHDLTGTFIADFVLQLLSYVAQVERENIKQRQAEGIAAAKARGAQFGRPAIKRPSSYEKIKKRYIRGEITRRQAAEELGICRSTFDKWINQDKGDAHTDHKKSCLKK